MPVIFDLISSFMQEQFFKHKTAQPWIGYITDTYSLENFHFISFTVYFKWPLEQPQMHSVIYSLIKAAFSGWCLPTLTELNYFSGIIWLYIFQFLLFWLLLGAGSGLALQILLFLAASSCSVGSSLTQW